MGRKKKNYKPGNKTLSIGDTVAYEICKAKKINISQAVTRLLLVLAYKPSTRNQHDINCLRNFLDMQREALFLEEEKNILKLQAKYKAERTFLAKRMQELTDIEIEFHAKQLEESKQEIIESIKND